MSVLRTLFAPAVPAHLSDVVAMRQYERVREFIPVLYLTIAVIAMAAGVAARNNLPWAFQTVIPAFFILMSLARMSAWRKQQKKGVNPERARHVLRSVSIAAIPIAMAGGGLAVAGFFLSEPSANALPPMFITLAALACANCLSSHPRAASLSLILTMVPIILVMLVWGETSIGAIAITMAVVTLLQFRFIHSTYQEMVANLLLQQDMRTLAETDPLSGLANRRAFTQRLEEMFTADDSQANFAITMIDLDGFKPANDRYGHAAGDAILVEVAERLRTLCVNECCVARIGGDEFAVILAPAFDRVTHAERTTAIQSILSMPYWEEGDLIHITASVGLACYPDDGRTMAALLKSADAALYAQKSRYYGDEDLPEDGGEDRQISLFG